MNLIKLIFTLKHTVFTDTYDIYSKLTITSRTYILLYKYTLITHNQHTHFPLMRSYACTKHKKTSPNKLWMLNIFTSSFKRKILSGKVC